MEWDLYFVFPKARWTLARLSVLSDPRSTFCTENANLSLVRHRLLREINNINIRWRPTFAPGLLISALRYIFFSLPQCSWELIATGLQQKVGLTWKLLQHCNYRNSVVPVLRCWFSTAIDRYKVTNFFFLNFDHGCWNGNISELYMLEVRYKMPHCSVAVALTHACIMHT